MTRKKEVREDMPTTIKEKVISTSKKKVIGDSSVNYPP